MRQISSPLPPKKCQRAEVPCAAIRSSSGCAENGAATRSSRQATGPRVSRVSGCTSMAEPPSQSANTRSPSLTTAVLAVLKSSLLRTGTALGMYVPAAPTRNLPARCSCTNLLVATMRAVCVTLPPPIRQARIRPSPSNQCSYRTPARSNNPGPLRYSVPVKLRGQRPSTVATVGPTASRPKLCHPGKPGLAAVRAHPTRHSARQRARQGGLREKRPAFHGAHRSRTVMAAGASVMSNFASLKCARRITVGLLLKP